MILELHQDLPFNTVKRERVKSAILLVAQHILCSLKLSLLFIIVLPILLLLESGLRIASNLPAFFPELCKAVMMQYFLSVLQIFEVILCELLSICCQVQVIVTNLSKFLIDCA